MACHGAMDFFLLVFKKKIIDKYHHRCFNLSVVHWRVKSAQNRRAAIYSLVLVLEACDILTRKQFSYLLPNKEKQYRIIEWFVQ